MIKNSILYIELNIINVILTQLYDLLKWQIALLLLNYFKFEIMENDNKYWLKDTFSDWKKDISTLEDTF